MGQQIIIIMMYFRRRKVYNIGARPVGGRDRGARARNILLCVRGAISRHL